MREVSQDKKKAKGTYRNSRSKKAIKMASIDQVVPPVELNKEAAEEWNAVVNLLQTEKIISDLDKKMLMVYCTEMAKYWEYSRQLEAESALLELKDKKGVVVNYMKNPLCDLANKALDNATKIATQFGLTPLSRTKLEVKEKPDDDSPEKQAEKAFSEILKKKGKQISMKAS